MGERGGKGAAVFEYAGSVMAVYRHGFDFSLTGHLDLLTYLFWPMKLAVVFSMILI